MIQCTDQSEIGHRTVLHIGSVPSAGEPATPRSSQVLSSESRRKTDFVYIWLSVAGKQRFHKFSSTTKLSLAESDKGFAAELLHNFNPT